MAAIAKVIRNLNREDVRAGLTIELQSGAKPSNPEPGWLMRAGIIAAHAGPHVHQSHETFKQARN